MPSHKVLLVEDDPEIARIISGYLAGEGFEVIWCQGAQEAMEHPSADFDAVLLDIMLGDGSGLDVCAQIRAGGDCPIIFVSCLDDPETMVTALELGGDDYIVKPFDKRVLAARLKANLRRIKGLQHEENQRSACSFRGSPSTSRPEQSKPPREERRDSPPWNISFCRFLSTTPTSSFPPQGSTSRFGARTAAGIPERSLFSSIPSEKRSRGILPSRATL